MRQPLAVLLTFALGVLVSRLLPATTPVVAAGPPDFADLIARADPGVVHVTTLLPGARAQGSRDDAVGAGFVFSADGLVVTSRHLLQGAERVLVTVLDRGSFEATLLGQDEATDVALLRIPLQGLEPLPIGEPRALRVGQWVLSAGSPFHLAHSWSAGIVSGLDRTQVGVNLKGFEDYIQTDAAANLGNSGGPLLDASGRVVGMMTAILSRTGQSQGISLAVPIDVVVAAARDLAQGRAPVRPSLGVIVRESDTRGFGAGLEITRFQPGSAAEAAGLRPGDVILEVAGRPVPRTSDLARVLWARSSGAEVPVVFRRGAQRFQLTVRLR